MNNVCEQEIKASRRVSFDSDDGILLFNKECSVSAISGKDESQGAPEDVVQFDDPSFPKTLLEAYHKLCQSTHQSPYEDNTSANRKQHLSSNTLCKYFRAGRCRFGEKCTYKHGLISIKSQASTVADEPNPYVEPLYHPDDPETLDDTIAEFNLQNFGSVFGNSQQSKLVDEIPPQSAPVGENCSRRPSKTPCKNLSSFGYCQFGSRCHFSHIKENEHWASSQQQPIQPRPRVLPPPPQVPPMQSQYVRQASAQYGYPSAQQMHQQQYLQVPQVHYGYPSGQQYVQVSPAQYGNPAPQYFYHP